jgi:oligogalacturonide transport system substrate-binding protein
LFNGTIILAGRVKTILVKKGCVMRRASLISVALLLAIAAVALCGGQEEAVPAEGTEEGPVTIRFSWWGGDSRHDGTLKAIETYMESHPNVTIEPEYGGWDGYYEKLVTQIAGGKAADVMQVTSRWVQPLYDRGAFYVWNDSGADYDTSSMEESFLDSFCVVDGNLVGFPTGMYADVMVYNKQIADEMGWDLSEPWTWEEYYSKCSELKQQYPDSYGLANKVASIAIQPMYAQLAQWAGHTNLATEDYEVGFSEDLVEQALSYWKKFADEGLLAPLSESQMYSGNIQDMPMWLDGRVFSITIPSSVISKFKATENLEIGVAPLPVMEGASETGINNGPPQVFGVSKNSENPKAAIEFIDWMINSEEAALQLKTVRGLPASSVSREVLVDEGLVDPLTAEAMDVASPYLGSKRNAISQDVEIKETVMETVLEKVLRGVLTPAEGAEEWISSLERLLEEKQAAAAD